MSSQNKKQCSGDDDGIAGPQALRRVRRVRIEEHQDRVIEHLRGSLKYGEDDDPRAHDRATFELINQRRALDKLPHADYVIPALDEWKHWTKMNDSDSRNHLLAELTRKLRRKEATAGEIQLLVIVCRPTWASIAAKLRLYAGVDGADSSPSPFGQEELRRVEHGQHRQERPLQFARQPTELAIEASKPLERRRLYAGGSAGRSSALVKSSVVV
jgi:hypothetical protein